jgi:hypothetical protein
MSTPPSQDPHSDELAQAFGWMVSASGLAGLLITGVMALIGAGNAMSGAAPNYTGAGPLLLAAAAAFGLFGFLARR